MGDLIGRGDEVTLGSEVWAREFVTLQQLVADFFDEIDVGMGRKAASYYTEDGQFLVGGNTIGGHEAITAFYAAREKRILAEQKDGLRTSRHAFTNCRLKLEDSDRAHFTYLLINFSGEGGAPLFGQTTPTIVSDCHMEFVRSASGEWRIYRFGNAPIFVGNDPFLNRAVVKS